MPPEPGAELAALNAAERMLAEVATVADAANLMALADAIRDVLQRAKIGTVAVNHATVVKVRAAYRLADLVDEGQASGAIAERGDRANARAAGVSTLAELGVDSQRLAEARRIRDAYTLAKLLDMMREADAADLVLSYRELARPGPHVANNSGVSEWYTPAEYIASAVAVMGGIDLDPASTAQANEVVGATVFYENDTSGGGLARHWHGRVWLNPPYSQPAVQEFAERLVAEYTGGSVTAAITLTNNSTDTAWWQWLAKHSAAVCFPAGRVPFLDPAGNPAHPLQGQALLYLGPYPAQFVAEFERFGVAWAVAR